MSLKGFHSRRDRRVDHGRRLCHPTEVTSGVAFVSERTHEVSTRSGFAARIRIEPSLDEAVRPVMIGAGRRSNMSSEEKT